MIGIEGRFDIAERLVDLRAKKFFVQMTARQAVAMFAAHRAAELDNQIGHASRNPLKPRDDVCMRV